MVALPLPAASRHDKCMMQAPASYHSWACCASTQPAGVPVKRPFSWATHLQREGAHAWLARRQALLNSCIERRQREVKEVYVLVRLRPPNNSRAWPQALQGAVAWGEAG